MSVMYSQIYNQKIRYIDMKVMTTICWSMYSDNYNYM